MCALGLSWHEELVWPGGLRAAVLVAVWLPDAIVRLDFSSSLKAFTVTSAHHSRIAGCDINRGAGMTCEFVLGGGPDEKHGFGFITRGEGPAVRPPRFSCDSVSAAGSSTQSARSLPSRVPPLPPLIEPTSAPGTEAAGGAGSGCLMGAKLSIKTVWQAGYRAA
eukprot:1904481-Prymnesium_polylepis.1